MPEPEGPYGIWSPHASQIFSQQWLSYMRGLGLPVHHALVFYRAKGITSQEAHVDTDADTGEFINFALNWVLGGRGSKMHWYRALRNNYVTAVKDSNTRVPYTTIKFENLERIESTEIQPNEVVLVRTNYPHSISMGNEPRWCISARIDSQNIRSWPEIVEHFKTKGLLVERI